MSVSFFVEMGEVTGFKVSCGCESAVSEDFEKYSDVESFLIMYQMEAKSFEGCTDPDFCMAYRPSSVAIDDTEGMATVNMSNGNARDVLSYLEIDPDVEHWSGSFKAEDLEAKILLALVAGEDSEEVPTIQTGNQIMCGRPANYVQDKLVAILEVVQDAKTLNREVIWG